MSSFFQMFMNTLGSAAVVSAIAALFFASQKRRELHQEDKALHSLLIAVVFGLLSIYASVSAVSVDGVLSNCRTLPVLYAGMVGGPISGIISGLIGGLFRFFAYSTPSDVPCMLACFLAGVIGSSIHITVKKKYRFNLLTGLCASLVTEGCHMLITALFGYPDVVAKVALPMILSNVLGLAFCLYIYKHFTGNPDQTEE